jgi:hypothetical protein
VRSIATATERNSVLGKPYRVTPTGKVVADSTWAKVNLVWVPFPEPLEAHGGCLAHRLLETQLGNVFTNLADEKLWRLFHSFDGSYCVRRIRGASAISVHSWAAAFDFNAQEKPLNADAPWPKEVLDVFRGHGFINGGQWKRRDWMHFEARGVWP